jgi:hypothetical protein
VTTTTSMPYLMSQDCDADSLSHCYVLDNDGDSLFYAMIRRGQSNDENTL